MKPLIAAVITYGDPDFRQTMEKALEDYTGIRVLFFNRLAAGVVEMARCAVVLINADEFHNREDRADELYKLMKGARSDRESIVIMLTKNLKADEFLRNQVYKVTDTIDIGDGVETLKMELDGFLARARQMDIFEEPGEKDAGSGGV